MPFVLDASVTASWALKDEDNPIAARVLKRLAEDEAHVPALWWFEVRNTLAISERRNRLAPADLAIFLRTLANFAIVVNDLPSEQSVFALTRRHRLSFYDASYLELARREKWPLATLDKALASAAGAERVELVD